jgi:hypothetical protein
MTTLITLILGLLILVGCPEPGNPGNQNGNGNDNGNNSGDNNGNGDNNGDGNNSGNGYGVTDAAWAADPYNAKYRIFPNAPDEGILEYPWGSGTNNYFDQNAAPSYWNGKGHNHKYPDLFHFANGNKVQNIADWENRRKEIFNILQYYMHGRMPSIDPEVVTIRWQDDGNTCKINILHIESGKSTNFNVAHTPPQGAEAGAKDKILLFGVGMAPSARIGWGTARFDTDWGGSERDRSGTCATLYGLNAGAVDTPSVNMEYAWAMSVILTVIEEGGFQGYYDKAKVGIYGFSRWGKAAMCIGAFAEGRGGSQIGQTFIGSAGSGGPSLDRFIAQVGYKNHTEDPLPVEGAGARTFADLKGISWFQRTITGAAATPAAGANDREVIRGWAADTPGIPEGSLIYNEAYSTAFKPWQSAGFGGVQNLSQARNEMGGWFSARFRQLNDMHDGLDLDHDKNQTGRGKEGVLCTMPFDAHFISALIAPRIIYYEDGYDTVRNNPEAQWANWLICDEIYQMYAEERGDPSIIWRNAIKFYHIPHSHQAYQNQDEYDLVTAIYSDAQPNAKFRTPPFPVDDPRYRWDFDRMDFGRPGHPTIAERVRKMRENPVPVNAMDTRGLLDNPEPLN